MQDLGRFAADTLLFYTQEFGFVELPEAFTTGSSIMPQKRNPDVFELIRGRSASAQACLAEALGICAKLPSGYQRDLQLLKFPLFRGIDLAQQTLDILPAAIDAMKFRPERIKLDPAIHAAEEANRLVVEEGHSVPGSLQAGGGEAQRGMTSGAWGRPACQCESAGGVLGGTTFCIRGMNSVATMRQTMIARKVSAKACVCASRKVSDQS